MFKRIIITLISISYLCSCINLNEDKGDFLKALDTEILALPQEGTYQLKKMVLAEVKQDPGLIPVTAFRLSYINQDDFDELMKEFISHESRELKSIAAEAIALRDQENFNKYLINYIDDGRGYIPYLLARIIPIFYKEKKASGDSRIIINTLRNIIPATYEIRFSGETSLAETTLEALVNYWDTFYGTNDFYDMIVSLRKYSRNYNLVLDDERGDKNSLIKYLGIKGDPYSFSRLHAEINPDIRNSSHNKIFEGNRELKIALESLSIITNKAAVNLLINLHKNALKRGNKTNSLFVEKLIQTSYNFHVYLIDHGDEYSKIEALESFRIFKNIGMGEISLMYLQKKLEKKPKNPLVRDKIRNCIKVLSK